MSESSEIFNAAGHYTELGMIVHPLVSPLNSVEGAGKKPIETGWQTRDTTRTNAEIVRFWGPGAKDQYNIGLQCGKRSGVIVIDVDDFNPAIWNDLTAGENTENWIKSNRTKGRGHIYFKYTPAVKSQKHHNIGVEVLSDGSNSVLPPSKHKTGEFYKFNKMPENSDDIPVMSDSFIKKLNALFECNNRLKNAVGRCKPCLRDKFTANCETPNPDDFHGSDGRQLTLSMFADLQANGAGQDELILACKIIFRDGYKEKDSLKEVKQIGKPWQCKTIESKLSFITKTAQNGTRCTDCEFRGKKQTEPANHQTQPKQPEPSANDIDPLDVDQDEYGIPEEDLKAAETEAMDILASGDPVSYILEVVKKRHTGDENTQEGIAVSIAGQSCLNTGGLQVSVNGETGSGKSHALKTHLNLVPRRFKRETGLSAKAAFYMDIRPGVILFSDDTDPDETMEETIKRATTNYQEYTYRNTVKDGNGKALSIPPRINWYLTSVENNTSAQLLSRQMTFSTDSGAAQKNAIFEMQKQEAAAGEVLMLVVDHETLVCRRIYGAVKGKMFKVRIPFVERIDIIDKSDSRIFPMFLDMIKCYAIFKNEQRKLDEEGYLLAEIDDFNRAKRLFESQSQNLVTKLTERERRIIQFIRLHPNSSISRIADGVGLSYLTVARCLNGRSDREESGLLNKFTGLSVADMTLTTEEEQGLRTGRREKIYSVKNVDVWGLFSSEFVKLKNE